VVGVPAGAHRGDPRRSLAVRLPLPSAARPGRRDIFIAPRGVGKSTWHFLIVPLWAAATRRVSFAVAFADSATQAELHLATFKRELDTNDRLRQDYPQLCRPSRKPHGGTVADNRAMIHVASGFAFAARGIDSGNLGMKVGDQRPDLLICDDVEPGSSQYSAYMVEKRLATITDVILPMGSQDARAVLTGTTTMSGSIIHQAVLHAGNVESAPWIQETGFRIHHALPFTDGPDGAPVSVWPERWPTPSLLAQQGSRSFALNFLNQPAALDGQYWVPEDIRIAPLPSISRRIIAVDPAVTTARSSDQTGIAVLSYSASARAACVDHVIGVRLKGEPLRALLIDLLRRFPDTQYVLWERNQGGDSLPHSTLHDFPVEVRTVHNSEKKELRVERALSYYRRRAVTHAESFPQLDAQMTEFPKALHDDLVDAVSLGLDELAATPAQRARLRQGVR
jgi:predicted phage terminase large subunit-like protein